MLYVQEWGRGGGCTCRQVVGIGLLVDMVDVCSECKLVEIESRTVAVKWSWCETERIPF